MIGLANPRYRVSDESFCRQSLSREQVIERKYPTMTVVNFFMFGISKPHYLLSFFLLVTGWIVAFCVWFIQVKLPSLGKDNQEVNKKIDKLRRKREMEAMNSSRVQSRDANQSLSMSVIQEDINEYR